MSLIRKTYGILLSKWIFCSALVVLSLQEGSTQQAIIDSLKQELTKETHDTSKVLLLLEIFNLTSYEHKDEAERYLAEAIDLSKNNENQYYYFKTLINKGRHFVDYEVSIGMSIPVFWEALDVAKSINYDRGVAVALMDIADAYYYANLMDKAFLYYKEGLEYSTEIGYSDYIMWNLNDLALILDSKGDWEEAFYYYEEGRKVAEKVKDPMWMSAFYNNIAEIYRERKDSKNSIIYYQKALEITQNPEDSFLVHMNLGQLYTADKKFDLAKTNLEKALELVIKHDIYDEFFSIHCRWGDYYLAVGQYDKAFETYHKVEDSIQLALPYYIESFMQYASVDLYKSMAMAYEVTNEPELALAYHKKYQIIQDTLFKKDRRKLILSFDTKHKMEQKEIENKLLKAESDAYVTLVQKTTTSIIAGFVITFLFIAVTYKLYSNNRRNKIYALKLENEVQERIHDLKITNTKLEQSNSELESFASVSSHDLKEPLRTIAGFTSLLEANLIRENYDNIPTALNFIKTNVQRMFRLIEDILAYSQVDKSTDNDQSLTFDQIQAHVFNSIQTLIQEKEAQIIYGFCQREIANVKVPSKLKIVFKNLIENGIKYNNNSPPTVWVNYRQKINGSNVFSIKDNGIGIDKEYHETIFKMFKRLHTKEEYNGTGIGLAICKKIVENIGGQLFLEESDEQGSLFVVEIPVA